MGDELYTEEWYREHLQYRDEYRAVADAIISPGSRTLVLDYGCGVGLMLERWLESLRVQAVGFEPSKAAKRVIPEAVLPHVTDHISAMYYGYPVVTCFEVGEHIPADEAYGLCLTLAAVVARWGTLIFSAAPPGQGGHGHVNEQPKEYWIAKLRDVGFSLDEGATAALAPRLKTAAPRMPWLGRNVMVFRRGPE